MHHLEPHHVHLQHHPPPAESSDTEVMPVRTPPGYRGYPPSPEQYHPPYYPSPPASASHQYPPQVPPAYYLPEISPNPCAYLGGPYHHQPGYFHHGRSSPFYHIPSHHRWSPAALPPYVTAGVAGGPPTYHFQEYYGPPPPASPGDHPPPPLPQQQQHHHHHLQQQQHHHHHHHHLQQQLYQQQQQPLPPPDAYTVTQPLCYSPYGAPPGPSCYSPAPPRAYVDRYTPINYDNNININNNNCDGESIAKGSAKRKRPNPMQIAWAKKLKIKDETEETDNGDYATAAIDDDIKEDKYHADLSSTAATMTTATTTTATITTTATTTTATTTTATTTTATTTTAEDEPAVTVKRENSNKSEHEILDDCMSEEILQSVLMDESDGDDMKKGRKDRKNGANKKEMTDAMKREPEQRMREEFAQLSQLRNQELAPRWSNGWTWQGQPFIRPVHLENDDTPVLRKCYPSMRHTRGDTIYARDRVLLKSGFRKNDLPFIAKITDLWEDPVNGEMMMSLLWYYRPEHTKQGRQEVDMPDELFASKHRDVNSVACIEDRCYVLTFNEYCRHRKHAKSVQKNLALCKAVVPPLREVNPRTRQLPTDGVPSDLIFFCRRVYDC